MKKTSKKLTLNKMTISNLSASEMNRHVGGAKPDTRADCGTATLWKSWCVCAPTQGGGCSYGTLCCTPKDTWLCGAKL